MAEGLLQKLLVRAGREDVRVISAGTVAPKGMLPPPSVNKVMQTEKVNVAGHEALLLTKELIAQSHLIIAMTAQHRQEILRLEPQAVGRVYLLKEFSPKPEERVLSLPDPIGCPLPFYEKALSDIKSCLTELMKGLDKYLP